MSTLPYGSWPSPITTQSMTAAQARLDEVAVDGQDTYWLEGRPWESGRQVLVRHDGSTGKRTDVLAAHWNVRSRVHEYGGGAYAVAQGTVVFSEFTDGRLRQVDAGSADPVPLTDEAEVRYGGLVLNDRWVYAVREDHRGEGQPVNEIVRIAWRRNANGVDSEDKATPRSPGQGSDRLGEVLVSGRDFYSRPAVSPDGSHVAWVSWDHPNMPWDSTTLHLATLNEQGVADVTKVAGGGGISVSQPCFAPDGSLWFFSDETGWWNPYRHADGQTHHVVAREADLATPQWTLGQHDIAFLADSTAVLRNADASQSPLLLLSSGSELKPLSFTATHTELLAASGHDIALKRGLVERLPEIIRFTVGEQPSVLAHSSEERVDPDYVSRAEPVEWINGEGLTAYGNFYAPTHADVIGPEGNLPPLLVMVHGGPTSRAESSYQSAVQFWTTRGLAVLDVNHGGSTGYGREYRERLRGQWGVVDIDDCVSGARAMAAQGRVDGERLAIRGGSAGGYTTLRALTSSDAFAAGVSLFGISDLKALLDDSHKFESRYTIGLVGPWPEAADIYEQRSPLAHIEQLHGELLLLQGADDLVVPLAQAQQMADAMRAAGKEVELVVYEGEGHGFRSAATIEDALTRELSHYASVFGFTTDVSPLPSTP